MSIDPGDAVSGTQRRSLTAGDGSGRPGIGRAATTLGAPVAALLAIAGQFFLANKAGTAWSGVIPGIGLYLIAITILLAALISGRRAADRPSAAVGLPAELKPGLEWGLVAGVVVIGLFLRVHAIDMIPRGLNNDEAINAIEAIEIVEGKPFSTVTERGLNRETMFHYLAAFSYEHPQIALNLVRAMPAVFGLQSRLINDPLIDRVFPLRAVSIAVGTLTLLALYLFARRRFGWHVALLATLFLAFSPWHLLYSRVGLRSILAPLLAIGATALFLRARDSGRLHDHLLWSGVVGLGLWSYTSFRAVPVAMVAFLLMTLPVGRGKRPAGSTWTMRPLLIGGGVAALLACILWFFSSLSIGDFLFRGAYATLPPRASWGANLLHALTMMNYFPPSYAVIQSDAFISDGVSTTFGAIGLEPEAIVTAALAALGLLYAGWRGLRREGEPACTLPVLGVLALLFTVGWTGPSLTRMLLNVPWLCLFAALFAWRVYADIAALRRPITVWVGGAAVAGMAFLACAQGYSNYFLQAGRSKYAMQNFGPAQTIMGSFVRTLPQDQAVYVLHTRMVDSLKFLIGDRQNVHLIADPSAVDLDDIAGQPGTTAFVIEHTRIFAEPMKYLVNRFQLLQSTASFADSRFPDAVCITAGPDASSTLGGPCTSDAECGTAGSCQERTVFWRSTLWKDESGRPIPPPGVMPDAPSGMSFPDPPGTPPPGS
jgi:4-amino-4-deoxy-L-arabinose transferase-like glycosyltransferase